METRMWVWSTCPWWNRDVQITEFVKQWILAQLHSEADASKDGQIWPHIRRPYPAGAGYGRYENWAGFRPGPGPDMISAATLRIIRPLTEALYTTFYTTNAQKIHTSGNWALVCMHQLTCTGVMCYVAVNLHDVVADEGDKTPVQGVHARCRHDEPGGGNQSLPQLLSRLVSNASHSSGCRRDGNCRQLVILSALSVWQLLLRDVIDGRISGERPKLETSKRR